MSLYIGLMSGTSMDGIDAALVDIPSNKLICGIVKKYSDAVTKSLLDVMQAQTVHLASLCQLNTLIGRDFASAVLDLMQEARVNPQQISAIGSHGQTVCHDANATIPYTLQLGCAHTISSLTRIPVVADFRTKDLINGGQGAPFAPLYHQELFAHNNQTVAVVNIGGISNISFIEPHEVTLGWDVGPGNCLMDAWIYKHHGRLYDAHGDWAKQGVVLQDLLKTLLADSFLSLSAPKSIGKEYYSLSWLEQFLKPEYKPVDVQATLLAYTAKTISDTLLSKICAKQLYLCGGGSHNDHLLATLKQFLPEVQVQSCASAGINPDFLEAMMFAWLAAQTMNQNPVDLSAITGSTGSHILGAVYSPR